MPLKLFKSEQPVIKNIIGIAAGKGGVGKSTVTVNLAIALKRKGFNVAILDADIYGPSLKQMLPPDRFPVQKGELIEPALSAGIKIISMAYFKREHEAAAVRAPIANGMISQFLQNVVWGDLDFLLIDFPPGTGDIQLTLAQKASLTGAVLVTTPQKVSQLDVGKAADLFMQVKIPILGFIENMSYFQTGPEDEKRRLFGQGAALRLSQEFGAPILAELPLDPAIGVAGDAGKPFDLTQPWLDLADKFLEQVELVKMKKPACDLVWKNGEENFVLDWYDGVKKKYSFSELQQACPCAACVDESTGVRRPTTAPVSKNLKARKFYSVGRYALRVEFEEGCSAGIYSFDFLKGFGEVVK